jgi:FixJ family two-component response regulator
MSGPQVLEQLCARGPAKRCLAKSIGCDLNKTVAANMGLSERMEEEHWAKVREKLGVGSVATLATSIAELRAYDLKLSA